MTRRLPFLILLFCAAAFAFGLFELFKLRYEAGDVYPPYSSLRSDPLGTMAFYESLARMPGISVRRDFSADNRLPTGREVAYFHLAGSSEEWASMPEDLVQEVDDFLARGGRLVITLFPEKTRSFRATPAPTGFPKKSGKRSKSEEERLLRRTSLKKKWGVEFGFRALASARGETYEPARVINRTDLPLPDSLDWHSAMILTNLDGAWRTIYARGTNPVVAEREVGSGTVVMATDSYFVSNEALSKERHADLLAWLVGPGRQVVFDEAHFGIVETSGITMLMRQYRLHGLVAGLLLLAGLFIWKNSTSFAPPYPDELVKGPVAGKEAAAGFVNLLRRNIPARDVLRVCFEEWTGTLQRRSGYSIARVDQAQAVLEAENAKARVERDPVRAYQEICRVLKGSKNS
ncbi:MAG TPA: DUF4350 domain-containing protein [Candidatus Acidoferrum sp.]|jgi:hypothetical protein|nr:DUF4350 domain-containing protein [Candidatus Acidoferrum sp.]